MPGSHGRQEKLSCRDVHSFSLLFTGTRGENEWASGRDKLSCLSCETRLKEQLEIKTRNISYHVVIPLHHVTRFKGNRSTFFRHRFVQIDCRHVRRLLHYSRKYAFHVETSSNHLYYFHFSLTKPLFEFQIIHLMLSRHWSWDFYHKNYQSCSIVIHATIKCPSLAIPKKWI